MLSHCAPISIHSTNKYLSSCVRNLSCITLPSTGNTFSLGANWLNFSSYNLQTSKLLYERLNAATPSTLASSAPPLKSGGLLALWQFAHFASIIGCKSLRKSTVLLFSSVNPSTG